MTVEPKIVALAETHLVGVHKTMSRSANLTPDLWRSFMPRRGEVRHRSNSNFISMQIFPNGPAQVADPEATFTKWAAVEVSPDSNLPEGMQRYTLSGGLYAVFHHQGPATDISTFMYAFGTWLPGSAYALDDREHFEVLPENYQPMAPDAEEDIWIPIVAQ
ncbi:MAG: GyrI-like domain-containing protein [Pseudomonadales bacterium]|jgi:AraC family transcriptional regulator|nr:GyrI-like domain-containing protein [Pseudomonadales bacterium]